MLRCVITRPDIYVINSHTAIAGSQCKGSKVSIFLALRGLKQEQVGPLTPPLHMTCGSWEHPPQGAQWAPIALGAHGSPWVHLTISWSLRIHSVQLIVRTWCWPEVYGGICSYLGVHTLNDHGRPGQFWHEFSLFPDAECYMFNVRLIPS